MRKITQHNKILAVEYRATDSLTPAPRNARTHSEHQISQIAASIREFGWTNPILIEEDGQIIAGHGRVQAAQALGMGDVATITLRGLSPAQKRALVLADNKLALNAGWDDALLRSELADLKLEAFDISKIGFSADELADIFADRTAGLTDPDDAPDVEATVISKPGDLWLLGRHRLLCGDATSLQDIRYAAGDKPVQMVFTDPPYGVDYSGGAKKRARVANDNIGTGIYASALVHLREVADDKAPLYLWYADAHAAAAAAAAAAAGYDIVAQIIWAKNHAQFVTSAHYKGKHEPCYYAHRRGKAARWHGKNNEVTLWECERSPRNDFHPTQKPTALAERALNNSSLPGQSVLDMFSGSGSTIIAAEMTGRSCIALEIAGQYCDVSVRRWQDFTGQRAMHAETGEPFPEALADAA